MPHYRTPFEGSAQPHAVRLAVAAAIAACLLCLNAQAQTAAAATAATAATAASSTPITARMLAQRLEWTSAVPHGRAVLRIAREGGAPQDIVLRDPLALSLQDTPLPDGRYTYELTLAPATAAIRREDAPVAPTQPEGTVGALFSASVSIAGGAFVLPPDVPPPGEAAVTAASASTPASASQRMVLKDQVVSDDHIIQGGVCAGLDCVNGETFGDDTLRLKENNLRIGFYDTRTAPLPNSHWTVLANDSTSGGANYLGIADAADSSGSNITANQVKARWAAGAPASSLYVSPLGRVGLRTATPVLDLHVLSSNTPGLRQEQNNLGGFTPQTWDIAGNEANFFVRDLTGGSRLPLRIRPGAPHSSLDIASDGNVGMGTPRPTAPLTLRRSDGTGRLQVDNTTAAASAARVQMELRNNGDIATRLAHGTSTAYWTQLSTASGVSLAASGSGSSALSVQSNGNLAVVGTLSQGSSRTLKHDITAAPVHAILSEVAQIPVYAWQYLSDLNASLHLGPMAEDVHQRFKLGADPKTLAISDVAGLAAATVQALHEKLAAKDEELLALAQRLSALERLIDRLPRGGHP